MFEYRVCSKLQTAADNRRERGAAFLSRCTEATHAGSACLLRHGIRALLLLSEADNQSQHAKPLCLCSRTPRRGSALCLRPFVAHCI
ncbi:hypothetical protein Y032_0041g351 [Ancylostoma ceylanicum]|uniref:Uncharacterized protein n=1 Tax=Ancylostoma ceylanicum TaxID=53326 RepID=A0A016UFN3_9BILA|nr:hypothetical protein Y032_0041g351 [Ancylostoma ceylanicum]